MQPSWLTALAPSPWYLDKGQVRDKDGNALASVPWSLNDYQYSANSILMVAAPDMLEALEVIKSYLEIDARWLDGYADAWLAVITVIAKARGEE